MEKDSAGNVEEVGELDYEKMVMNLYPRTEFRIVPHGSIDEFLYEVWLYSDENTVQDVISGFSREYVWERTWKKIEERMLRKLAIK